MNKVTLLKGDCLQKLKELKDNSVDSVVTDPPYGIGFMGKAWDTFDTKNVDKANKEATKSYKKTKDTKQDNPNLKGRKNAPIGGKATFAGTYDLSPKGTLQYQKFCEEWGRECLRVLKPGGHLLSSCSPRMYHRMTVGLEDAGFEIRDQIMWVYGSGFPKSHNIGKAVEKLSGDVKVIGKKKGAATKQEVYNHNWKSEYDEIEINNQYEGWGTALKPAHEPIVMARKPFKGSVAQNVLEYGTGGINIDECRVGYRDEADEKSSIPGSYNTKQESIDNALFGYIGGEGNGHNSQGRFPANIIFDEEAGKILDEQSGYSDYTKKKDGKPGGKTFGGSDMKAEKGHWPKDSGGASRFFYCPKASKKDRNDGCDELEEKETRITNMTGLGTEITIDKRKTDNGFTAPKQKNIHPTVKPTDLMSYLVRLVTPKGGTVLDPFMGSGSTGKASVREGMDFIGIEREDEYMEIAKSRIEHEKGKHNYRKFFDI